MKVTVAVFCSCLSISAPIQARVQRYANQGRVQVGNRSPNVNQNFNRNTNVNRNVNVNNNVNVNRNVNVNVHGGYYGGGCCYYHDDPNWGAFAAGAAIGVATTAAVAAATSHKTTVVVQAPAVGSTIGILPGGCSTVSAPGTVIYSCNNVYYRPFYQGTSLVYQVVRYP
jgi:hypothetical protein